MDFKGITWVGDIYQKFEAMCLEVEEVVCDDTVKFVENQVQTVGASVKKFYSDVMEDLLPSSAVDPVKVAVAELSVNPYGDFGTNKKPKGNIKKDTLKLDKQVAKTSKMIADVRFSELSDRSHFPPPSSAVLTKGARPGLLSEQNKDRRSYESPNVPIKRKSEGNTNPPLAMLRSITPGLKESIRETTCRDLCGNHEAVCEQLVTTECPSSTEVTVREFEAGKLCNDTISSSALIAEAPGDMQTSDLTPMESCEKKETELRSSYSDGSCTNSGEVFPTELFISGNTRCSGSANVDGGPARAGRSGDCKLDGTEAYREVGPGIDSVAQFDSSNLEETCVLVDGENIGLVSNREDKSRSYKKKIRKAFSSKKSARKQEYQQLAVQYGDLDTRPNKKDMESSDAILTADVDTEKFPTHTSSESEWELL